MSEKLLTISIKSIKYANEEGSGAVSCNLSGGQNPLIASSEREHSWYFTTNGNAHKLLLCFGSWELWEKSNFSSRATSEKTAYLKLSIWKNNIPWKMEIVNSSPEFIYKTLQCQTRHISDLFASHQIFSHISFMSTPLWKLNSSAVSFIIKDCVPLYIFQ